MTALLVDDNSFAFGDLSHFSLAKSMSSSSIPYHHNLSTTKEASQVHTLSPLFFESFSAVQTFSSSQVSAAFSQLPSASPSETTTTTQSESPSLESQVSQEENAQPNESAAVLRPLFDELRDIEVKFNARRPHPWAMPPKTQADILVEACSLIREHEALLNNLEGLVAQAIAAKQAKRRRRFSNNNNNSHNSSNSSRSPLPLLPADMDSWLPSPCGALHSTLFMDSEISRCVMSATPDMLLLEANNMFLSSPGLSDAARQAVRSGSQQLSLRDWIAPMFLAAIPQIFGGLMQDHHFVLDVISTPLALTHPDNSLALRSRAILYPSFQDDSHHFSNNNNNNNNNDEHIRQRPAKISCINVIITHRTLIPMTPELLALSANDHFYTSSFLACAHPPKFLVRAFSADFKL